MLLLLAGLAVAGCSGGSGSAASTTGATELTITRSDDSGSAPGVDLDCAGAGAAVCERVVALLPDLRPADGEVCTQIYGGPERIEVRGTVDGAPVHVEVTRENGCEIARYDELEAALRG